MKRFIFLVIASIAMGKFVGAYLNDFADNHAPKIHKHFTSDHSDDGLRMGAIPDNFAPPTYKAMIPPKSVQLQLPATTVKPIAVVAKANAAEEAKKKKKKEDDEKEKEKEKKLAAEKAAAARPPLFFAQAPMQPYVPQPFQYPGATSYGGAIAMPAPAAAAVANANNPAAPTKTNPVSGGVTAPTTNLSTWINTLVNQPSAAQMQQFTALYTSGKVTEAQFFTVMNAMEKSSVLESRTLLVQTLNGIKKTQSFQILSDVSATDSDSGTRAQAIQAVDSYNNVSYLSILSTALSSSDVNEAINAAVDVQAVAKSAQQNMTASTQSLFKPLVQILEPLTQSTNANLRQYATTALNSVLEITGTSVAGN